MTTEFARPKAASVLERNPRISTFLDMTARHFQNECFRLRSLAPMREFQELVGRTHNILKDLHDRYGFDRAGDQLAIEFTLARCESWDAWRAIWRDFHLNRKNEREFYKLLENSSGQKDALRIYRECLELAAANPEPEFADVNEVMLCAAKAMLTAPKDLRPRRWFGLEWVMLWIRLSAFQVFITYFLARISFLVLKHLRITLFAVLGTGFAYGIAGQWGVEGVAKLSPPSWAIWVLGAGLLGVGILKQYWLSDRVKSYLKKWERKRLFALALQLNTVRVMALVFRTGDTRLDTAGSKTIS